MSKMTRVFQLNPMPNSVNLVRCKKTDTWHTDNRSNYNKKQIFVHGQGYLTVTDTWEKATIEPLESITAKQLQTIAATYGLNGATAMIQGWGNQSLLDDGSYGLTWAKYEVANMVRYGQAYDDFTDKVQAIGELFIQGLKDNGFTLLGGDRGTIWYGYKDDNDCGNLAGFYGIYAKIKLHPLQYIEHNIGAACLGLSIPPSFNAIEFDEMLVTLFMAKYKSDEVLSKLDQIVSVKDRIENLAGVKAANAIEGIFDLLYELQKSI